MTYWNVMKGLPPDIHATKASRQLNLTYKKGLYSVLPHMFVSVKSKCLGGPNCLAFGLAVSSGT